MVLPRLDDCAARLDRVAGDPASVRAPLSRLLRPVLSRLDRDPPLRADALRALTEALGTVAWCGGAGFFEARAGRLEVAVYELEHNVSALERRAVVRGSAPPSLIAWVRDAHRVLARVAGVDPDRRDPVAMRRAAGADPVTALPPLRARPDADEDPATTRAVALQLGAVDHLLRSSRAGGLPLGHRRRLLEAARQVLLDVSAAVDLDPAGLEARRARIAAEIVRLDRVQAAGVSPEVGLVHQLEGALQRGDTKTFHAALVALDEVALAADDEALLARTDRALRALWRGGDPSAAAARASSMERSRVELHGEALRDAVEAAWTSTLGAQSSSWATARTLDAMAAADGCFEVGGALAPVRVTEWSTRPRAVRHPTRAMALSPARDPSDVPDAVIEDPRMLLLSLAAGRLLARRFVADDPVPTTRVVLQGEVRVYVLDGSSSMEGPRARMRDALLAGELAVMLRRWETGGRAARVVLYYRYFTQELGDLARVDHADAARVALDAVLTTKREGGTDIQRALEACFEAIREARSRDADLARAQVVLVTDGEAEVDEVALERARRGAGDLPIAMSVVALGQENPALRRVAARQRARGERAFYHFVPDAALAAMESGEADPGAALHLPAGAGFSELPSPESAGALRAAVGDLVDEIVALSRARDVDAMTAVAHHRSALAEVGLDAARAWSEGERAHAEAMQRDQRVLGLRYARWFPATTTAHEEPVDEADVDDVEAVTVALATVADVVEVVSGSTLARQADAIDVLERLLPDAGLTPSRYLALLARYPQRARDALADVHRAVGHTPAS